MAQVTALHLSHFRSHRQSRMALDPRPVVLFGPNGAGKTNVLEAVSLLSPGRGLRRAAADDITRRPEALGWKLKADVTGHEIETWTEGGPRQVRLNGKAAPQSALAPVAPVIWLVPVMDRLWVEGAEGRRRFLDRATLSFDPAHGERVLTYEKAMRERNRLLKDQTRDSHWYEALEGRMAESGTAIQTARQATLTRLMAAQAGAETSFPAAELTLTHADIPFPDDLRSALAEHRPRDLMAGRTLIGPHRSDLEAIWQAKGTPARECSTGEQKALLVSLILANARALEPRPLVLLDEVAAHLDQDRRAALYDEICALKVQAWMTGTGPELFDSLGDRAQSFLVTEIDGTSDISAS